MLMVEKIMGFMGRYDNKSCIKGVIGCGSFCEEMGTLLRNLINYLFSYLTYD